jgi:hypothetical protein
MEEELNQVRLFKMGVDAEDIDLAKIGWTEFRDDKQTLSYIRGYVWRNYKVRVKPPMDTIIFYMLDDILRVEQKREAKHEVTNGLPPTAKAVGIRPTTL